MPRDAAPRRESSTGSRRAGAERETDADFRASLPGEVGHHPVQADGASSSAMPPNRPDERGHHALWGDGLVEEASQSLRTGDDDTGIDGAYRRAHAGQQHERIPCAARTCSVTPDS